MYYSNIYTNVDQTLMLSIGAAESGYYKVKYMLKKNNVYVNNYKYIFRTPRPFITKMVEYYKNTTLISPELILVREPLKFKDILVTNNSYIAL